jgi:hypothetical protein
MQNFLTKIMNPIPNIPGTWRSFANRIRLSSRLMAGLVLLGGCPAWSQDASATHAVPAQREWTNLDGRKISADYLGIQGSNVVLKLSDGTISQVPLVKLSAADNEFIRLNPIEYHEPWHAWPKERSGATTQAVVTEESAGAGDFVYTTRNFKFHSDVNLGMQLMTDMARVFELTYDLHSKSPFGILATPENKRFEARLFGTLDSYLNAGGKEETSGIYLRKEKVFLAPLELMGVRKGSAGWRKDSNDYSLDTVIHELTHMLTHDMLDNLPTWLNEGYAEYISHIPIEGKRFRTSPEQIREGIQEMFVQEYEKSRTRPDSKPARLDKAARATFLTGNDLPELFKVEKFLQMTDHEWATGSKATPPPATGKPPTPGVKPMIFSQIPDPTRLPRLYRTAHLIIYYFIQIEGENGVNKIRRFLEENRNNLAKYEQYREQYRIYEQEVLHFMELPGVTKTPDGRIRYPSNLQLPSAPKPPFTDPNILKQGGLIMLLARESPAAVGRRIEGALIKDLGMNLKFVENPKPALFPRFKR